MTDNRTTELLPCPFREHNRKRLVIHHRKCRWHEGGLYAVKCEICGIRGPYALSEEKAIEKWNTRHVETCEMEYVSDFMSWHCKACDMMDMAPRDPKPRFCKRCGRRVE